MTYEAETKLSWRGDRPRLCRCSRNAEISTTTIGTRTSFSRVCRCNNKRHAYRTSGNCGLHAVSSMTRKIRTDAGGEMAERIFLPTISIAVMREKSTVIMRQENAPLLSEDWAWCQTDIACYEILIHVHTQKRILSQYFRYMRKGKNCYEIYFIIWRVIFVLYAVYAVYTDIYVLYLILTVSQFNMLILWNNIFSY